MKPANHTSALFSVVIPAFNRAAWLERAIESVLAQELPPHEIVVIDDGSTDETPSVLARYFGRVKVLSQQNQGLSAVRNRGAREASGRYVVYLDCDDLLFPWALKTLHGIVERCGEPALVLSHVRGFRSEAELLDARYEAPEIDLWKDYLESASTCYWMGVAGAIRRDVLLGRGGFLNEAAGAEDHDFWLRAGTAGGFVYVRAPRLYAHRQHGESITRQSASVFRGVSFVLDQERAGRYAGGRERAVERRRIIARLICWGVTRCYQTGGVRLGYCLYWRGLGILLAAGFARQVVRLPTIPIRLLLGSWIRGHSTARARTLYSDEAIY